MSHLIFSISIVVFFVFRYIRKYLVYEFCFNKHLTERQLVLYPYFVIVIFLIQMIAFGFGFHQLLLFF